MWRIKCNFTKPSSPELKLYTSSVLMRSKVRVKAICSHATCAPMALLGPRLHRLEELMDRQEARGLDAAGRPDPG